jgi:serine/threonine-protein kinase
MSPEQCSGGAIDQRSDVYSVGCVLFEALTGTPPFSGTNALRTMMQHVSDPAPSLKEAALGAEFPEAIEQIVKRMLAKSPADRYSEMGVVAHDLYVVCGRPESSNADTVQTTKRLKESVSAPKSTNISLTYLQLGAAIFATILVSVLGTLLYEQFNVREVTPSSEEIDSMKKLESSLKGAPKAWSLITNPTADAAVLVHRK